MPSTSPEALRRKRQRDRESREWYKAHGICPRCRHEWSKPGGVYCEECLRKNRETYKQFDASGYAKQRREKLKALGLCVNCTKPAVPGKVLCAVCARKNAETQQVTKLRRKLQKEAQHGNNNNTP